MKIDRRQLRRLIESVINEVNPAQKEDEKKQKMKEAEEQYEFLIELISGTLEARENDRARLEAMDEIEAQIAHDGAIATTEITGRSVNRTDEAQLNRIGMVHNRKKGGTMSKLFQTIGFKDFDDTGNLGQVIEKLFPDGINDLKSGDYPTLKALYDANR